MIRLFIETDDFRSLLDQKKDFTLERNIKDEILKDPGAGSLLSGTGGFRKIRVANRAKKRGKSGSFRVIYFDLPSARTTYLVFIFEKDELETLTSGHKKALRDIAEGIKNGHKNWNNKEKLWRSFS